MKSKTDRTIPRNLRTKHIQGEGLNWVFVAGGALLSSLSVGIGYKVKQILDAKKPVNSANHDLKGNRNSTLKRRAGACPIHSNAYCFTQDEDGCYHCLSEGMESKQHPRSPFSKETDLTLSLVTIPPTESNKDNGMMWGSSPERLELPPKPFHHSNSSDSPCVSESGSDIFSKREVIHKLRQQLKRRDEMILEMQAQITDLQNSLNTHTSQSAHLQSQLDSANQELFVSEREIQRLRKVIADHCVGGMDSPEKPALARNQRIEARNGHVNGFLDEANNLEVQFSGIEKGTGNSSRYKMLKNEVGELKEVIEGKEFLLQSYKEQQMELCSTIKELQLRLASQVPNIL
ncbi:autophagy-related protein 23-like isoform X2 [Aristolochia californica]|uniref:autophagy-related protein 23-like isoform X2 n=1 Tax=Aristolochia californica TaxID=171875 RepID=UPI0035DF28C0